MAQKVITANRLGDGIVVFLGNEGSWVRSIDDSVIYAEGPDLETAQAYAQAQHDERIVVEPYVIDVTVANGRTIAVRLREKIRADGPTVDYGADEAARLSRPS